MVGNIPPQALDIEKAFLGALLLEGSKIKDFRGILSEEAFYDPKNEKVYSAIKEIDREGGKVDILTVSQYLRDRNSEVSAVYVSGLTSNVASGAHISEHMAIIYEKWVAREAIRLGMDLTERAYNSPDILETVQDVRNAINDRVMHFLGINSSGIQISDAANISLEDYFKRKQAKMEGKVSGVPSTFIKLDKKTGGFQNGQLVVLAARPGMGKTSMAISFMSTAAEKDFGCAFYSLETSAPRLMDKVVCMEGNISFSDYKAGALDHEREQWAEKALDKISKWNVVLSDSMLTSIEQIHANCRKLKDKGMLHLVFIDYLQLMKTTEKTGSREQEVSTISRKAKLMALDLDVPVILMSQLNRSLEARSDKRPQLSDLRESGAIEQDADIVLFIYREAVYDDDSARNKGEIIVAKHREGETGILKFNHNDSLTKFWDVEDTFPFPNESDNETNPF